MIFLSSRAARLKPMDIRKALWERRTPTAHLSDRMGKHDSYSVSISSKTKSGDYETLDRAVAALLRYDIYPPKRMRGQVCSADGNVVDGALIIQRIFFGPIAIEAAVRVVEMIYSPETRQAGGFSYVTLNGHAEKGVATFKVGFDQNGRLVFSIESWSRPGDLLGAILAPISRILQKAFSREALTYFSLAASQRPSTAS